MVALFGPTLLARNTVGIMDVIARPKGIALLISSYGFQKQANGSVNSTRVLFAI